MHFVRKLVANSTYASFGLSGFISPIHYTVHLVANMLQFGSCSLAVVHSYGKALGFCNFPEYHEPNCKQILL